MMEATQETAAAPEKAYVAYQSVNGQWPSGDLPELSGEEAIAVAKRLYRFVFKRSWRGKWKLTSGNRYTWPRGSTFYVNPQGQHFGGWRDLVHFMSHYAHRQLKPTHRPHSPAHESMERDMIAHIVEQGWLDGRFKKAPKEAPDKSKIKRDRIDASIARWEAKARRAETALRKLRRQKAYYDRKAI